MSKQTKTRTPDTGRFTSDTQEEHEFSSQLAVLEEQFEESGHSQKMTDSGTATGSAYVRNQDYDTTGVSSDPGDSTTVINEKKQQISSLLDKAESVFDDLLERGLFDEQDRRGLIEALKKVLNKKEVNDLFTMCAEELRTQLLGLSMVGVIEEGGEELSENHDKIT